ncbi:permease of the major facilitator superfamily [Pediococcus damnosus]|uniref:Permease of the major facilitator superfamily n=1 Tax=Pediococcus damnosus TaxID=51663 RepID=A0AAC9B1C9_9LACO|nr:permease of the major facilitator superfamily [Pediococcus damnosus]AMV67814.1 permease of the major facilitator superfamily [Pediococcus damnosus]
MDLLQDLNFTGFYVIVLLTFYENIIKIRKVLHSLKNKFVLLTNMLVNMGIGLIMPITTLYIHGTLHKSIVTAGYVLFCFSGAMMIGNLIGGKLFDSWKQKPLMYLCGSGVVIALFLVGLFPQWPIYPILITCYGLCLGGLNSSINGYLAFLQVSDPNIFNNGYWFASLGMGLATFLSGILFGVSIRVVFFSSAILFLFTTLIIRVAFHPIKKHVQTKPTTSFKSKTDRSFLNVLIICLAMIIIWICYEQWNSNVSVLMVAKHISIPKYSMLFTISTVEIVLVQPFMNRFFKPAFQSEKKRIILGLLAFACSYLFILNAESYWRFVAGITMVTLGEMLALIAIPAVLNRYASDQNRGTIQSLGSFAGSLGRALGPLLGGYFITGFGYNWTFLGMFIIHLLLIFPILSLKLSKQE